MGKHQQEEGCSEQHPQHRHHVLPTRPGHAASCYLFYIVGIMTICGGLTEDDDNNYIVD
jgi:hypothetical protein